MTTLPVFPLTCSSSVFLFPRPSLLKQHSNFFCVFCWRDSKNRCLFVTMSTVCTCLSLLLAPSSNCLYCGINLLPAATPFLWLIISHCLSIPEKSEEDLLNHLLHHFREQSTLNLLDCVWMRFKFWSCQVLSRNIKFSMGFTLNFYYALPFVKF